MSNQFNSDDYYTVLGIDRNQADENAIKKAYRKLAIKWHPVSHRIVFSNTRSAFLMLYVPVNLGQKSRQLGGCSRSI